MVELMSVFFQRIGLLLVLAFMLTRIPSFRYLLDRKLSYRTVLYHSLIFGLFGIIGTQLGVLIEHNQIISHGLILRLTQAGMILGPSLVAVVIAGVMGGPSVGLGSGIVVGVYTFFLGGEELFANTIINPLAGLLAGITARFFSQERVIAPVKAMFIGMFVPTLHMALMLVFTDTPEQTIALVDQIGLPLVVSNSIAIGVFTAMIRVALFEQEQEAVIATSRSLRIAEDTLPYLRQGLNFKTATQIAKLLQNELKLAAVSITNNEQVLAHIGLGSDHHTQGEWLKTGLSHHALETGEIQVALNKDQIQCLRQDCALHAAILMPLRQNGEVVGLMKMFFQRSQQLRTVDLALAEGLGKFISNQLDIAAAQNLKALVQETQLRNFQAQIHPHFLFNTLHLISTLIRVDPDLARHILIQLGNFMRLNLKITSVPLIPLGKELEHLGAYLEIIKVRFSDQLTIAWQIEEGVESAYIPPFTLQPLVENCVKHGLVNVSTGGVIQVKAYKKEGEISIEICDNGRGFPSEVMDQLGKKPLSNKYGGGNGLYNVNQRLIRLLGTHSSLQINNMLEKGSSVSIHLPIPSEEERSRYEHSSYDCGR